MYLTCSSLRHASRRPSSLLLCHPSLPLLRRLPCPSPSAFLCNLTPPPSPRSGTRPFPHLVLGRDVTSSRVSFWDELFHTALFIFFWFALISFPFFADCSAAHFGWSFPFPPADRPLSLLTGALGPPLSFTNAGGFPFRESTRAAPYEHKAQCRSYSFVFLSFLFLIR
jgi:hypothetical protein